MTRATLILSAVAFLALVTLAGLAPRRPRAVDPPARHPVPATLWKLTRDRDARARKAGLLKGEARG